MTSNKPTALFTFLFSITIVSLYAFDKIGFLINPNYYWYVLVSASFSLLMALIYLFPFNIRSLNVFNKNSLFDTVVFTVLLVSIFVIPIVPLNSTSISASSQDSSAISVSRSSSAAVVTTSPAVISSLGLSDWVITLGYSDNAQQFDGQAIEISGFVSKYTDDGFALSVYLISCCVVDATLVSITIVSSDKPAIDSWNKIEGKIKVTGRKPNQTFALAQTKLTSLPTPSNPYASK